MLLWTQFLFVKYQLIKEFSATMSFEEKSINIVYKVHRICGRMKYQPIVLFLKAIICQELN
jgi:hypothetical protein